MDMTTENLVILGTVLFVVTVIAIILTRLYRDNRIKDLTTNNLLENWALLGNYAMTAVKDTEQLFMKENLPVDERLTHALEILYKLAPKLQEDSELAKALIREAVYNMNNEK